MFKYSLKSFRSRRDCNTFAKIDIFFPISSCIQQHLTIPSSVGLQPRNTPLIPVAALYFIG